MWTLYEGQCVLLSLTVEVSCCYTVLVSVAQWDHAIMVERLNLPLQERSVVTVHNDNPEQLAFA